MVNGKQAVYNYIGHDKGCKNWGDNGCISAVISKWVCGSINKGQW